MSESLRLLRARGIQWWIRRNPLYLLSAACVAIGARMLLVSPGDVPGDVGLILLTLIALQCYEWSVTGFLILLHRKKRSPEDEPSLLLVGALFWTGPLVATMEMTAKRADLGLILAAAACLITLVELFTVARVMNYRFSTVGKMIASSCVILVASAQPLLKIQPGADQTNEVLLYFLWWILAGVGLLGLLAIKSYSRVEWPYGFIRERWTYFGVEIGLIIVSLAAAAAHLVAMNHAFIGHTKLFYASPLLISLAVVGMELGKRINAPKGYLVAGCFWMPAIAMVFAHQRFSREFPIEALPGLFHDPMTLVAPAAALAWLFGYYRHRWLPLLHLSVLTVAFAGIRNLGDVVPAEYSRRLCCATLSITNGQVIAAVYAIAVYSAVLAVVRKNRAAGVLAAVAQQIGLIMIIGDSGYRGDMIMVLTGAWTLLIIAHLSARRMAFIVRVIPVIVLVVASAKYSAYANLKGAVMVHAVFMVLTLFVLGQLFPWTRYRTVSIVAVVIFVSPVLTDWLENGKHTKAIAVTVGGFILLVAGALVSWNKSVLLEKVNPSLPPGDSEPESEQL